MQLAEAVAKIREQLEEFGSRQLSRSLEIIPKRGAFDWFHRQINTAGVLPKIEDPDYVFVRDLP